MRLRLQARPVLLDQSLQTLRVFDAPTVNHTPLLGGWTCVRITWERLAGSEGLVGLHYAANDNKLWSDFPQSTLSLHVDCS